MEFETSLLVGTLLQRYKRFLADVRLADGSVITAHTPNTGSMLGCAEPGSRVWLRAVDNPQRKYPHAWELVENAAGVLIGINTGVVNHLVREAISGGVIRELQGYATLRQEVRYGSENSRIDLLLEGNGRPPCYVEIKNVTAVDAAGTAFFPDAVSARGSKHLRELIQVVAQGRRAVLCFCVQRADARAVRPADEIDPRYGQTLREAVAAGVEALAYRATVTPHGVVLDTALPIRL
ncbi:DNA/RNA nuclease SfsA [Sulfurivermis fontis]|uniref:DNA/RNA nuclease SfsA n=1 Tax=Sulfurivermis fontis TaxID=1972068 RepID=UPI000FDBC7DB|nr:DNA/RNA nuclease SfsA [Sulfurivermis fontis]